MRGGVECYYVLGAVGGHLEGDMVRWILGKNERGLQIGIERDNWGMMMMMMMDEIRDRR